MAAMRSDLESIQAALAGAGHPWEAGFTTLTPLSDAERQSYLGVAPAPGDPGIEEVAARAAAYQAALAAGAASGEAVGAPAAFDLRNVGGRNFVTPIKNQGGCGSCVAFGTVATVESTLRVARNDSNLAIDLSEAHLFYCHARSEGRNCGNGWWPERALEWFKSTGVADEACYPYTAGDQNCTNLCSDWRNRVLKITGYTKLTTAAQIRDWISQKGPVSACFIVYNDFFNYRSGVYKHVSGAQAGGHCVTIVGYDDTQKYWICKNSWGAGWGESGFFRIGYGECGIDTWYNHGVNGIEATGWQTAKRVNGLWTIDQTRNAWAHFDGLGWRKISPDTDNIFFDMLVQLTMAKAANRPVNFFEEQGVIKQIYVL